MLDQFLVNRVVITNLLSSENGVTVVALVNLTSKTKSIEL